MNDETIAPAGDDTDDAPFRHDSEAVRPGRFRDRWQLCPRRDCRRRRRCSVPRLDFCSNRPPLTSAQREKAKRRMLTSPLPLWERVPERSEGG